jgi:hypothetical protein
MKPSRRLIRAGFMFVAALNVLAGDMKIIASVSADSISTGELGSVFLLPRSTLKDGSPAVPVLAKSGAAHEAFLKQYPRPRQRENPNLLPGLGVYQ